MRTSGRYSEDGNSIYAKSERMRAGDQFGDSNSLMKEAMDATCSPPRLIPDMSKDISSLVAEILEFRVVAQR